MRSRARLGSHPIHPMLIPFPLAWMAGAIAMDLAGGGRRSWYQTARHLRVLGLGAATVAALPGLIDYLSVVPPQSSAADRAAKHGLANVGAAVLVAAVAATRRDDAAPTPIEVVTQLTAAALLGVAGYLGGDLVDRNQIGVDHRYADAGRWDERRLSAPDEASSVDVGAVDDLHVGQMRLLHVGQRRIVLARTETRLVAFDDRCSHRGGSLADGVLACDTVQCPWHGSQFSVLDGSVRQGPADTPIAVHEVHEQGGRAQLTLRA